MIGRVLGHVDRIGMAVLVGALLAGSAGFTFHDQVSAAALPTRILVSPDERIALQTQTRTAAVTSSVSHVNARAAESASGSARVAVYLEATEPRTSEVPVNSAVVMTFSQPMNRSSVETSFTISPAVDGRFVWSDDFTLRFEAFKLAHATAYQVEVQGRSLRGVPLAGSRWWTFNTAAAPPDVVAPGAYAINVPILTYHYIRVNPDRYDRMGFALSVTPADFVAQMDWLAENGYHPITTEDLHTYLQGARGLPSRPVVLSFDDGYTDFYTTALPILRSHDFKAVAYIVSGFVGQARYMTAAQVREADRSGIEIGSHTVSHANLATASSAASWAQLTESKQYLERLLGHPVVSFCYPSGKVTSAVAWQVGAAGYHDATTTRFGYSHTLGDRYLWTRLRISGGEPLDQFAMAVRGAS